MKNKEIKDLVDSKLSGKTEEEKKSWKTTKTILGGIALYWLFSGFLENLVKSDEHFFPKSSFKYDFLHSYRWPFVFGFSALFLLYGLPLIEDFIIENNIINLKPDPSEYLQYDYQDRLDNPSLPFWLEFIAFWIFYEILYFICFRKILWIKWMRSFDEPKDEDKTKKAGFGEVFAKWENERKKKK